MIIYYTVKEFAGKLNVSPTTIRRAILYGRIHAFRIGKGKRSSYRIISSELERMAAFDASEIIENRAKEIAENK